MNNQNSFNGMMKQLEDNLDLYLRQKAPALPTNIKELLVAIAPWAAIIGIIVSIPGILALLGLGTMFAPFGVRVGGFGLSVIFLIIMVILEGLAIPGLMKKSKQGWNYLFYATLVGAVQSLVEMNIFGLIIGTLIALYILFQVREYYK